MGEAYLASLRILNGVDQGTKLVAHGFGCDASSGRLEVDVTSTAYAGIEGFAPGHEGVGGHWSGCDGG